MEAGDDRLTRIRSRRDAHHLAIESATWYTAAELAARWHISETTVYAIPVEELPYKAIGKGKRPLRRYSPLAVAAYEAPAVPALAEAHV